MVLRYTGPSTETVYTATLSSAWNEVVGDYCLSYVFSLAANTAFNAMWVDSISMSEKTLFSYSPTPNMIAWNKVSPTSSVEYNLLQLQFPKLIKPAIPNKSCLAYTKV